MGEMPFPGWIPVFSGFVFPFWANLMVHSAVLIVTGLLVARAVRNRGAAVESLVLRLTLIAVLASPLASIAISSLGIRGLTVPAPRIIPEEDNVRNSGGEGDGVLFASAADGLFRGEKLLPGESSAVEGNGGGRPSAGPAAAFPGSLLRNLMIAAIVLWTVISLFLAGRLAVCFFLIRRIRSSADDAPPEVVRECWQLARTLEIEPPYVFQSLAVRSPFLTGLLRPAVLLPVCERDCPPVGREVLLHELAHLVRRDCLWNLLAHASIVILPLQPLARVLARRIEDVSDDVCDDYVVHNGGSRQDYARQLCSMAERFRPSLPELAMGVGIVTFKSSLGRRVERILDSTRYFTVRTGSRTAARLTAVCFISTALVGLTGFRGAQRESRIEAAPRELLQIVALIDSAPAPEATAGTAVTTETVPDVEIAGISNPLPPEKLPEPASPPVGTAGITMPERTVAADMTPKQPASDNMLAKAVIPESGVPATDIPMSAAEVPEPKTQYDTPGSSAVTPAAGEASAENEPALRVASLVRESEPAEPQAIPPSLDSEFLAQLTDRKTCMEIGERMIESGQYAEAEEAFKAALAFDSNSSEIMNRLGRVYFLERNYEKAAACLMIALSQKPDKGTTADANYNLGDVFMARGDLDKAMQHYKTAIKLNPAYSRRVRSFY